MRGIWVIIEQKNSRITKYSWNLIHAVTKIDGLEGHPLSAVLFSGDNNEISEEIYFLPVDNVFHILAGCDYGVWVVLATMLQEFRAAFIFSSSTQFANELMDYVTAENEWTFVKDCVGIAVRNQEVVFERPMVSGKAHEKMICSRDYPLAASFKTNDFFDQRTTARPNLERPVIYMVKPMSGIVSDEIRIIETIP